METVIVGIVTHEVDRQLAAHDELFEKRLAIRFRRIGAFHGNGDGVNTHLTEVKIRRKLAGAVNVGLIALR